MHEFDYTLLQYEMHVKETFFKENPNSGVTKKEYDECYPPRSRRQEYMDDLVKHAWNGGKISKKVLDNVAKEFSERNVFYFLKNHPGAVPEGYLLPSARLAGKANA